MNVLKAPINWLALTRVTVIEEVWKKIRSETRSTDMRMQKVQMKAVKALAPLAYVIDKLVSCQKQGTPPTSSDIKELLMASLDGWMDESGF